MPEEFFSNSNTEEKSQIEEMQEELYSRANRIKHKDRTKLRPKKFVTTEDWEGGEGALHFEEKEVSQRASLYKLIFVVSLTFFVVAGSLAGFMFFSKKQTISSENVSISAFGPVSIGGGDILTLQVLVANSNSVSLKDADLFIEFPEGTRYPNQSDKPFDRFHKTLGTIAPGEVRTETVKAVLLGGEQNIKNFIISSTYQIEGSSAKFTANKNYSVTLTSSALSVKTDLLKEVSAGQEVVLSMDVDSHSSSVLKGSLLQVDYPGGFIFESATPAPSFADNAWKLGDMAQGDHRHIEVKGIIQGEDSQEKVFRIYTGVVKNETSPALDVVFSSLLAGLVIKKPFLGISIAMNGSVDPGFVFNPRSGGNVAVSWKNNLPDKIIDGQIEVSVRGDIINRTTIKSQDGGFYRSLDDTIFWDKRTSQNLSVVPAGEQNTVAFSFSLLPLVSNNHTMFWNPEIEISVSVKGKRVSENNVPEAVNSFVTKKFKVATSLQFSGNSVYYLGPFSNIGPLPPKVQNETTYTIMWSIQNTANDVSGGRVKAVLPPSVEWKGLVSPNGAKVSFNPVSHEVSWDIGTIKSGTGYESNPQEIFFQVGLTPSLGQVDKSPALISEAVFEGKDDFTGVSIKQIVNPLSTMLSVDPQFEARQAVVVP